MSADTTYTASEQELAQLLVIELLAYVSALAKNQKLQLTVFDRHQFCSPVKW